MITNFYKHFQYLLFYPSCAVMPRKLSYKLATLKGMIDAKLNRELLAHSCNNIRSLFADMPSEYAESIAKAQQRMLAREIMDVYLLKRMNPTNINQFIKLRGLENYLDAKKTGRPLILYTSHFGRLIMPAMALGLKGHYTSALTQSIEGNSGLSSIDRYYLNYKISLMKLIMKGEFIQTSQPKRKLYQILQPGNTLIFLVDVPPAPGQSFCEIDFLGGVAKFNVGIVKLAIKTKALLVPFFVWEKEKELLGEFLPAFSPQGEDIRVLLANIMAPVEDKIRLHPEQWWQWPILESFWRKS